MTRRAPLSFSPEHVLKIAGTYQAPILMLDFPLTKRLRRHIIFGPDGKPLTQFKDVSDAVSNLAVNEATQFLVDASHWPRPMYATLHTHRRHAPWQK